MGAELQKFTPRERNKVVGYIVIGACFVVTGAVLMVYSKQYTIGNPLVTRDDFRQALHEDRSRDSMFNAGISICTSGLLIMLGFGLTEFLSVAFK